MSGGGPRSGSPAAPSASPVSVGSGPRSWAGPPSALGPCVPPGGWEPSQAASASRADRDNDKRLRFIMTPTVGQGPGRAQPTQRSLGGSSAHCDTRRARSVTPGRGSRGAGASPGANRLLARRLLSRRLAISRAGSRRNHLGRGVVTRRSVMGAGRCAQLGGYAHLGFLQYPVPDNRSHLSQPARLPFSSSMQASAPGGRRPSARPGRRPTGGRRPG